MGLPPWGVRVKGSVTLTTEMDLSDLIEQLANIGRSDLMDFVRKCDEVTADVDFTKELVEYLLESLAGEGVRLDPATGEWKEDA